MTSDLPDGYVLTDKGDGVYELSIDGEYETDMTADCMADAVAMVRYELEDRDEDRMPEPKYAVVGFGWRYGIVPMRLVNEKIDNVVTKTLSIEAAEAYLADLLDDDDDPYCHCGTARSEHQLCGCPEGFQRPGAWAVEKEWIQHMPEETYRAIYGDDGR